MDKEKEKEERTSTDLWNEFIESLIRARDIWEEHRESLSGMNQSDLELAFSAKVLNVFSLFPKAKFGIAIPRLLDFARGYGGLEELIIREEKEEKEEKEEDDNNTTDDATGSVRGYGS